MYEEQKKKKGFSKTANQHYLVQSQYATEKANEKMEIDKKQLNSPELSEAHKNGSNCSNKEDDKMEIEVKIQKLTIQENNPENPSAFCPEQGSQYSTEMIGESSEPENQEKQQSKEQQEQKNPNKLFKKGAYHVAIAYQIHLKNNKGLINAGGSSKELNPTYAKDKLFSQIGKKNYD